jgi:molybdopterin-binding protein
VSQITDNNDSIMLKVLAGELFEASITRKSFNEMGLGPGSEVCLNFKATSVEIL